MKPARVFIANRGIWAHRISRTCKGLRLSPVGGIVRSDIERAAADSVAREKYFRSIFDEHMIYSQGQGPDAFLNIKQVVEAAQKLNSQLLHPGIGLLSESAAFARCNMILTAPCTFRSNCCVLL
jgi:acetyl-CoA carboxylase biotin carboxylase subunit